MKTIKNKLHKTNEARNSSPGWDGVLSSTDRHNSPKQFVAVNVKILPIYYLCVYDRFVTTFSISQTNKIYSRTFSERIFRRSVALPLSPTMSFSRPSRNVRHKASASLYLSSFNKESTRYNIFKHKRCLLRKNQMRTLLLRQDGDRKRYIYSSNLSQCLSLV